MKPMLYVVQNFKMMFVCLKCDMRMFSMRNLKIFMKARIRIRAFNVRIHALNEVSYYVSVRENDVCVACNIAFQGSHEFGNFPFASRPHQ